MAHLRSVMDGPRRLTSLPPTMSNKATRRVSLNPSATLRLHAMSMMVYAVESTLLILKYSHAMPEVRFSRPVS